MASLSRCDALKLGAITAAAATYTIPALAMAPPKVGDLVCAEYRVYRGNGPWFGGYSGDPEGVTHAQSIGYFVGETDRHYLTCDTFARFEDGRVEPIQSKHWDKTGGITFRVLVHS